MEMEVEDSEVRCEVEVDRQKEKRGREEKSRCPAAFGACRSFPVRNGVAAVQGISQSHPPRCIRIESSSDVRFHNDTPLYSSTLHSFVILALWISYRQQSSRLRTLGEDVHRVPTVSIA